MSLQQCRLVLHQSSSGKRRGELEPLIPNSNAVVTWYFLEEVTDICEETVNCTWQVGIPSGSYESSIRTVDLLISKGHLTYKRPDGKPSVQTILENKSAVSEFLAVAVASADRESEIGVKLILPVGDGYISRADVISFRMHGCTLAKVVSDFVRPCQRVVSLAMQPKDDEGEQLQKILQAALGGMIANPYNSVSLTDAMMALESEVRSRLSLKWLLPQSIPYKRVALVKARRDDLSFEGIKALGIGLIILDAPGHWLEECHGPFSHLREAFVSFNLNPDKRFTQRLIEAVEGLQLDGIVTREEPLLARVAQAAAALGLPTSPASAFAISTDKHATRMLDGESASALRVATVAELQQHLNSSEKPLNIEYPLVVKPCLGSGSNCVSKVCTETELVQAVEKATSRIIGYEGAVPITSEVVIEPYIDGPEVDANFVMWKGEILFFDVSDDFPSTADKANASIGDDFQETMFIYPSRLPKEEQDLLRTSLRDSLLRAGLTTGVFHVEARVRNSSMHYVEKENGTFELEPRSTTSNLKPSIFLLEINARPPAYFGLMAVAWTYGVDFWALHVLRALDDEARFRALSIPFINGPQFDSGVVLIMPDKGGILTSADPGEIFKRRHPDLIANILLYREWFRKGERVPPPDGTTMAFLSILVVMSRNGRQGLLSLASTIRKEWQHTVE